MRFVWPTKEEVDAAAQELAEAGQAALDVCRVEQNYVKVRGSLSPDAEQVNRHHARCKEKHASLRCRYGVGQGYTLWSATASAPSAADWSLIRECFLWCCRHCGELTGWSDAVVYISEPLSHIVQSCSPCQSCCESQFLPETYSALCTAAQLGGPVLLLRLLEQVSEESGALPGLDGAPEIPPSLPKTEDSTTEEAA